MKYKYRLRAYKYYNNYYKGYYVLTRGKYKLIYSTISLCTMIKYIKESDIDFNEVFLGYNLTLDDLREFVDFEHNL